MARRRPTKRIVVKWYDIARKGDHSDLERVYLSVVPLCTEFAVVRFPLGLAPESVPEDYAKTLPIGRRLIQYVAVNGVLAAKVNLIYRFSVELAYGFSWGAPGDYDDPASGGIHEIVRSAWQTGLSQEFPDHDLEIVFIQMGTSEPEPALGALGAKDLPPLKVTRRARTPRGRTADEGQPAD